MDENMKKYWLERYKEDKIGTISKLSQAMQHMAWLREWQRVHGDEPRIKDTKDGRKINIAVPWSELDEYWRKNCEYGDGLTVKFLEERIERGDVSEITDKEIHDLSEKENVKWSEGKHSLNPLQGYLYSFTKDITGVFEGREAAESYGNFTPMGVYLYENNGPTDTDISQSLTDDAYSRVFATELVKRFLKLEGIEEEYKDSLIFNITNATTPEQIAELDKTIVDITHSSRFQYFMDELEGNAEYEKRLEDEIKKVVEIEIKKDSDRIENAHKVFVSLETGDLDEILEDPETLKWANEVYKKEMTKELEELEERLSNPNESGKSREELVMELLGSQNPGLDEVYWVQTVENDLLNAEKCPYLNQPISKREILLSKLIGKPYPTYFLDGVRNDAHESYRCEIRRGRNEQEINEIGAYSYNLFENKSIGIVEDEVMEGLGPKANSIDETGILEFGYDKDGKKIDGKIELPGRALYKAGIEPSDIGFKYGKIKESTTITSKSIIEADQKENATTKDLAPLEKNGFKKWLENIKEAFKNFITGKGEK